MSPTVSTLTPPSAGTGSFPEYQQKLAGEPVFVILGVQGSGTNLLSRILTRVFKFSVFRDGSRIFNAAARLGDSPTERQKMQEVRRFHALVAPSAGRQLMAQNLIRDNAPFRGIEPYLDGTSVSSGAQFARIIYAYRAYSLAARHLAIKSDDIWEHIHHIDEVLPNRRIILLTRDFRDNLLSVAGKNFGPVEPLSAALYVKHHFAPYAREYDRCNGNAYHVRFESLLTARRQFVDDFSLKFGIAPAVDPEVALATIPTRPHRTARWRSLDPALLQQCEAVLYDELVRFGYEPACPRTAAPGPVIRLRARTRDALRRVPQKLRRVLGERRG
jgi:hypothetical protein